MHSKVDSTRTDQAAPDDGESWCQCCHETFFNALDFRDL